MGPRRYDDRPSRGGRDDYRGPPPRDYGGGYGYPPRGDYSDSRRDAYSDRRFDDRRRDDRGYDYRRDDRGYDDRRGPDPRFDDRRRDYGPPRGGYDEPPRRY